MSDLSLRPAVVTRGRATVGLLLCSVVLGLPLAGLGPQVTSKRQKQKSPPATAPQTPPPQPASQIEQPLDPTAIDRYEPRVYDVKFEVVLAGFPWDPKQPAMSLENTPFVLPLIMRGPFSKVDPSTLQPALFMNNQPDKDVSSRARLEQNQELGMTYAIIPLKNYNGSTIRWSVSWRAQVWSCRIDERVLATKTWPREWPPEVRDALKAQAGIESDQPFAKAIAESALGANMRALPPWHAAKEVMRRVVTGFKGLDSVDYERRAGERPIGLRFTGAADAARDERGSKHDLVAVCVAAMRAADLPARVVVGFSEELRRSSAGGLTDSATLTSWGEVFVPEAGWVPFDPAELRGSAVRQLKLDAAWPGVGNIKELNKRVPIAWCFAPKGYASSNYASLWGWRPEGSTNLTSLEAVLQPSMTSRGKGVDDPK